MYLGDGYNMFGCDCVYLYECIICYFEDYLK